MNTLVANARVVFPGERIAVTSVRFAEGRIASVGDERPQPTDEVIEARGRLLTPGLVDLHVHGIQHYAFDRGPDDGMPEAEQLEAGALVRDRAIERAGDRDAAMEAREKVGGSRSRVLGRDEVALDLPREDRVWLERDRPPVANVVDEAGA